MFFNIKFWFGFKGWGINVYYTFLNAPHKYRFGPIFFPNFFLKHWLQIWLCCWKKVPTSNLELSLSLSSGYKPFFPLLLRFFVCFDLHFSKWTLHFFFWIYIFKCCVSSSISLCLLVLWIVVFTFFLFAFVFACLCSTFTIIFIFT